MEIEKLKILLRSQELWDEQRFMSLYEALTAKILSVSDLLGGERDNIRSRVYRMFGRVRASMGLSADVLELSNFANKLLSGGG